MINIPERCENEGYELQATRPAHWYDSQSWTKNTQQLGRSKRTRWVGRKGADHLIFCTWNTIRDIHSSHIPPTFYFSSRQRVKVKARFFLDWCAFANRPLLHRFRDPLPPKPERLRDDHSSFNRKMGAVTKKPNPPRFTEEFIIE